MGKKIGTLIKTFRGSRKSTRGDLYDTLTLFYRDENGEKKTIFYDRPTVDYYLIADKNSKEAIEHPLYIDINKVEKHTVYSDNLMYDIAKNTGTMTYYDRIKFNYGLTSYNGRQYLRNLFRHPLLYEADIDLEDQYISKFYTEFESDPNYKLHNCYLDIENDTFNYYGTVEEVRDNCPICLITIIDGKYYKSYTYILKNPINKKLTAFNNNPDEFKTYLNEKIKQVDNVDMEINLYFCDTETEVIESTLNKLHEIDPDYCGTWNGGYDIQSMMHRLEALYGSEDKRNKYAGKEAMQLAFTDHKYLYQTLSTGETVRLNPTAYFHITGKEKDINKRVSMFNVLDGINWKDDMEAYANLTISRGKLDSYKLDYVAYIELHKEKLEYGPGETIHNLLYINPQKFTEYNIRDVLLLVLINNITLHLESIQLLSNITKTRKDYCFMKSIALTNYVNEYARDKNKVMGTNKNAYWDAETKFYVDNYLSSNNILETDERYLTLYNRKDKYGAFVSNMTLNGKNGIELYKDALSEFIRVLVCDLDFSSLYPSILTAYNIDASSIIGKFYCVDNDIKTKLKNKYNCDVLFELSIKNKESDDDDDSEEDDEDEDDDIDDVINDKKHETDDIGQVMTDVIMSKDWNMFGSLFMDLPTTEELISELEKK